MSVKGISISPAFYLASILVVSLSTHALAQIPASSEGPGRPEVFSPGIISGGAHDSAPAFTPDGKHVYFTRSNPEISLILESSFADGLWTEPVIAPFSGRWNDMEPAIAPDGGTLVFISSRPLRQGEKPLDGHFNKATQPGRGGNLWRVERTADGWSEPVAFPPSINRSTSIFAPSLIRDGSVYFMESDAETGRFRIYRSQRRDGRYEPPLAVGFSDGSWSDVDPAVSPDETYAVFSSSRPHSPAGEKAKDMDLFLTFRCGGSWSTPIHMGDSVNSPTSDAEARLSPDGKTLFFSSERLVTSPQPLSGNAAPQTALDMAWNNGLYNIWYFSLALWLKAAPVCR